MLLHPTRRAGVAGLVESGDLSHRRRVLGVGGRQLKARV